MKKILFLLLLAPLFVIARDVEIQADGQVVLIADDGSRANGGSIKDAWLNNEPYRDLIEARANEKVEVDPNHAAIPVVVNLLAIKNVGETAPPTIDEQESAKYDAAANIEISDDALAAAKAQADKEAAELAAQQAKRADDAEKARVAELNRLFPQQ